MKEENGTQKNTTAPLFDASLLAQCQRWRERRDSYRPAGEVLDPRRYGVEEIDEASAKRFVERHHYSGTFPAARMSVALMRATRSGRSELAGVAVFSVPMNNHAIPKHCGVAAREGVELGRFVLLDCCEGNSETWFLSRAFRVLHQRLAEVKAVLSYADPVPRTTMDGAVVKPGHVGCAYASLNGIYKNRASPSTLILAPNGVVVSPRSLSKMRNGERGADGAYRRFVALGAPPRNIGEDMRVYIERALREGPWRKLRHPGNHVFVWPIGTPLVRRRLRAVIGPSLPYPKKTDVLQPIYVGNERT